MLDKRNKLAKIRTDLANHRTFLAYVRTALAFIMAGAVMLHYFSIHHGLYYTFGILFIVMGGVSLVVGAVIAIRLALSLRKYLD